VTAARRGEPDLVAYKAAVDLLLFSGWVGGSAVGVVLGAQFDPAAWGAGGAAKEAPDMGFQAIRVKIVIEGDAPREVLDEIVQHANFYSPVANSMRNPIPFEIALAD